MDPHRGGLPKRPGEEVLTAAGQTLLIEGMAPLMGRGQESRKGQTGHDARGDAEIGRSDRGRERMGGAGALAAAGVVAPFEQQCLAELVLGRFAQVPVGRRQRWQGCGLLEQQRQLLAQGFKQLLQALFADVRLKGLGQGLPAAAGFGQLARLLLAQAHQFGQGRGKQAIVPACLGLLPEGIAPGLGFGDLTDEQRIEPLLPFHVQSQQGQIAPGARFGICCQFRLGRRHQVAVFAAALAAMQLAGQQGQLLSPPRRPGGWHHRVLVVIESAVNRPQQLAGVQIGAQAPVGGGLVQGAQGGVHLSVEPAACRRPPVSSLHLSFLQPNATGSCPAAEPGQEL